jgi:hypothetical protein
MDPKGTRLRQEQDQREQQTLKESSTTEFRSYTVNSVEELLRKDAEQNPPPSALAYRVATGITEASHAVAEPKSWWQKLLGE